jgi:DNA repair protein RadC
MSDKNIPETLFRIAGMSDYLTSVTRLFKVRAITDGHKINTASQAYTKLLQGWDKEVMSWVKEYRTLVLDSSDRPRYLISFPVLGQEADQSNIAQLFEMVKELLPDAKKVIIGQNSPEKTVLPDLEEEAIARTFKTNGENLNIPVFRHLIMSPSALYAFDQPRHKKRQLGPRQLVRQ